MEVDMVKRISHMFYSEIELLFLVLFCGEILFPAFFQEKICCSSSFQTGTLIFGAIHILLENFRWQLTPIYCHCMLRLCFEFSQYQRLNLVLLSISSAFVIITCYLFPLVDPFHKDTGRFNSGCISQFVADQKTYKNSQKQKELMVEIYYPTLKKFSWREVRPTGSLVGVAGALLWFTVSENPSVLMPLLVVACILHDIRSSNSSMFIPDGTKVSDAAAKFAHLPQFLFSHLPRIRQNIFRGARAASPPLDSRQQWPVIIFCHGLGGSRTFYSSVVAEYASQGYVVVCPEHNDGSAAITIMPDGRATEYKKANHLEGEELYNFRNGQLNERSDEVQFVLDQLEEFCKGTPVWDKACAVGLDGKLSLEDLAVVGHSFGAATVAEAAKVDSRIKRVVCHDLWSFPLSEKILEEGLDKPAAFLHSYNFRVWKTNFEKEAQLVQACKKEFVIQATLLDSGHQNFSDFAVLAPEINRFFKNTGCESPTTLTSAINEFTLKFLRQTECGSSSSKTAPIDNITAKRSLPLEKKSWVQGVTILFQQNLYNSKE